MKEYLTQMEEYWDKRYSNEGNIRGTTPSVSMMYALKKFLDHNVQKLLIPGAGYGRNTKWFSYNGIDVVGLDISGVAIKIAKDYDPQTTFYKGSVLDVPIEPEEYDAIYCYNLLHLFREKERKELIEKFYGSLKPGGIVYITVFSELEKSFGKGKMIEKNTFESKPGRPVHYFDEDDIKEFHQIGFENIETGLIEEPENHGEEGVHLHILRYIYAKKSL